LPIGNCRLPIGLKSRRSGTREMISR